MNRERRFPPFLAFIAIALIAKHHARRRFGYSHKHHRFSDHSRWHTNRFRHRCHFDHYSPAEETSSEYI